MIGMLGDVQHLAYCGSGIVLSKMLLCITINCTKKETNLVNRFDSPCPGDCRKINQVNCQVPPGLDKTLVLPVQMICTANTRQQSQAS